ncbi:hypothetical protein [Lampropedia aestuarii]|uniref:hypothetical protein n=1 Tax=Lampropedia aestuarii TaxID=2562762 RepID=UPI002468666A|nr:hypothetical protein [Lampropedia aestuarii]MDH5855932.1 hypothetical protein [Lampropedia aestuarii]
MFLLLRLFCIGISVLAAMVWWQKAQMQVWATTRIDPLPEVRQMVERQELAQADQYLDFFMEYDYVKHNPQAQQLQQHIKDTRSSYLYQLKSIGQGLALGQSDEDLGQIAAVVSDLMVVGDLRDLGVQGWRWANDEATDPVLIALASLGVAATAAQIGGAAATVPTAGASTAVTVSASTVKTATTTLKSMRRLNKLPNWLSTSLVSTAQQMRRQRSLAGMQEAQALLSNVATLSQVPGGARLLARTHDAASLASAARFARIHGKNTLALERISGRSLNQTMQLSQQYGAQAVELAATYGQRGLQILQRTGATNFIKYSARASKIAYKGDAARLLMRWMSALPDALLALLTIFGLLALWPRRRKKRYSVRAQ